MIQKILVLILLCFITESIAGKNSIDDLLNTRKKIESLFGLHDVQIVRRELNNILLTNNADSAFTTNVNSILDTCKTSEKIILEPVKAFDNQYYKQLFENFLKLENKKVLFFGTSVSCHCTLEMCDEFLKELISNSQKNGLHYIYVDAFYNHYLMKEYTALFIPTAVILDGKNNVISLIENGDSLKAELNKVIKKNDWR